MVVGLAVRSTWTNDQYRARLLSGAEGDDYEAAAQATFAGVLPAVVRAPLALPALATITPRSTTAAARIR